MQHAIAPLDAPTGGLAKRPLSDRRLPVVSRQKPRTISVRSISQRSLERGRRDYPETDHQRPQTRGECDSLDGPCPFVSCRWHLYLDVNARNGSIVLNFPGLEVHELAETCALDVADRGESTLSEIAAVINRNRERARQIQEEALAHLRLAGELAGLLDGSEGEGR